MDAEAITLTMETDAAPSSGSSFYFPAAVDAAAMAASGEAATTVADVTLSGFFFYSAAVAMAMVTDSDSDADANANYSN